MIAVDVNVLINANRAEMDLHEAATGWLRRLAEGSAVWGLPAIAIWGFLRIVTQPVFDPPTPMAQALSFVDALHNSPSVRVLSPGPRHWAVLRSTIEADRVTGRLMTDAAIVAVCREFGVTQVLSADADFARFGGIQWLPLTA